MTRGLGLIAALGAAAVLAGCGSSATKTVTVTTATTPTTPAIAPTATLKAAEAANPAIAQQVAAAVAACKTSINAQSSLTASDKTQLDAICDKAGSGDTAGVQKATAQVCQQIVKDTVPASAQTQALAACPKP